MTSRNKGKHCNHEPGDTDYKRANGHAKSNGSPPFGSPPCMGFTAAKPLNGKWPLLSGHVTGA
jgi:hypothetical protein